MSQYHQYREVEMAAKGRKDFSLSLSLGPLPPPAPRSLRGRMERDCTIVAPGHCGCCKLRSRVNAVVTSQTSRTPAHYSLLLCTSSCTD